MTQPLPYAWLCQRCSHLATEHLLDPRGTAPDPDHPGRSAGGPFKCRRCHCRIHGNETMTGLTRAEYAAYKGGDGR